ncbi:MAG: glycosyltransferase [Candidatus Moranbacteria bacterium]|nr:glycosyltransferase [Candidatus Moranbacteria bacterium]
MKLLLIKVGKAIKTIQRDGILKGGKRVFSAFFALFRFVGKGDILFVTGGVGDSARYRTHHVAEELEMQNFKCSITVQDNPLLATYADKFQIFVFHRVLLTPSVKKLIEKIKAQGKKIIFETDDLVYDSKYLQHMDYFKVMNSLERKLYENGVGGEILVDPYVKVCTTTTTFLAEKLREHGKKVFIVPNRLSKKDVKIANEIISHQSSVIKNTVRLGYFSGTLSHNKDFATITDVLMFIMEKNENVELFLVGPLDLENKLNKFGARIKQLPYVKREKHFVNLAAVDINIVPLEMGNPFCESKSELKFFEAAIVGVPTVAAATQPFFEAIVDGVDGFVANDSEQWIEKLEKLINSSELRKSMGEKAREKAFEKYTTTNASNEEYYEYLRSKIKINV